MEIKAAAKQDFEKARTVDEQWRTYTRLRDNGHIAYVTLAKKCDDYYVGEQWAKDVIDELDAAKRPHHTINLVLSTVNAVLGEYISKRQQITFKPLRGGATQDTADALTLVEHQIQQNNKSRWVEQQVFGDGLIQDRGFFDIRIDFSDNVEGEVREVALDPADVLLDTGAKEYDPSTWNEVMTTRWMTPDEIEVLYGRDKADKLRYLEGTNSFGIDSVQFDTETFAQDKSYFVTHADTGIVDEARRVRRIRVLEHQRREIKKCRYFVDPVMGDERDVPETWDAKKVDAFAAKFGLLTHSKIERRIRWSVTADHVLLWDKWSPYKRFTVVPFFPYFRRGRPTGLVRHLLSPQDMLNKGVSQELHVVNTTANSGWIIQAGSLANMTADEMRQVGAKTGLVLEYNRGFEKPEKITANQIPTGLDRISGKAATYFREISGVSAAMLGMEKAEVSGVALENKQVRGLVQMEVIFDNLAKTRQYRAEFHLELIQQYYTETRLVRITERDVTGEETQQEMSVNQPTAEGTILNDLTLGEYSVVVSSMPMREAMEESEFARLIALRTAGVLVPDWLIVENAGLSNRDEAVKFAKKMAGAAEPSPQEVERMLAMQDMEMRMMQAQAGEMEAKANERMANVQLILAKAEQAAGANQVELQKLGADLRVQMENLSAQVRGQQTEMMTRLRISREKNSSALQAAQYQALTKRLDTDSKERGVRLTTAAKMVDTAAKSAAARQKAVAQSKTKKAA